ncbi:MAG: MFS transporter [Armatimonadota bacterium]|nr:MFS transporter [Armatimonadota bacterium]
MAAIPAAVRRNTWLLLAAQVMLSIGLSTSAQLGSLIIYRLTHSTALAGVPTAIYALALAAVGYPAGRVMDRYGRRPGLVVGFAVGAVGAGLIAFEVSLRTFTGFLLGMVVFSLGVGVGMLTRAAAADMYPVEYRAAGVGRVVTGGLVGGIAGPALVAAGDRLAPVLGADPLAVPWGFVALAYAAAAAVVARLRPDPREISRRLRDFFPQAASAASQEPAGAPPPSVRQVVGDRLAQAAMVGLACAQATMVILMATSSVMLAFHGHAMSTISLALMAHVVGMFAFATPVGRLADRVGRRPVLAGGALLSAASGLVFTIGAASALVAAAAFFLVGLGWCLAFVAGAALLGDLSSATTRARVMGLGDVFTNLAAMTAAVAGGVLLARGGELAVGTAAAALGSLPLLALLRAGPVVVREPAQAAAVGGGK